MADAGFYRGTSFDQDSRFTDKQRKLLKQMRFEKSLETKVDVSKVNLDVVKPWIARKVNDILGMEDDVVTEYVFSQLEEKNIEPKHMQINLTGFLNAKRAREFMGELWSLLAEAQITEDGIPPALIEMKMKEMEKAADTKQEKPNSGGDSRRDRRSSPSHRSADDRNRSNNDWRNRYESISRGRYSGPTEPPTRGDRERGGGDRVRVGGGDQRGSRREREETPPRRRAYDSISAGKRGGSPSRVSPPRRRFTEEKSGEKRRRFTEDNNSDDRRRRVRSSSRDRTNGSKEGGVKIKQEVASSDDEVKIKKKKKRSKRDSSDDRSSSADDTNAKRKSTKKKHHKKHKKHHKKRKTASSDESA